MSNKKGNISNWLFWAIGISVVTIILPATLYFLKFHESLSDDNADWGTFGDFMNVFVSIASLSILTIFTYKIDQHNKKQEKQQKEKEDLNYFRFSVLKGGHAILSLLRSITNEQENFRKSLGLELPLLTIISDYTTVNRIIKYFDHQSIYYSYLNQFNNNDITRILQIIDYFHNANKSILISNNIAHKKK